LGLAGAPADDQPHRHGPHDQRRLVGLLRPVVCGCRGGRPARAADTSAGPARLPDRGRLPARQQGVLAAVRALAAAPGGDGAPAPARPDDLAGGRDLLLRLGVVVSRYLPQPQRRWRRRLLLAGRRGPGRRTAVPGGDRYPRPADAGARRRARPPTLPPAPLLLAAHGTGSPHARPRRGRLRRAGGRAVFTAYSPSHLVVLALFTIGTVGLLVYGPRVRGTPAERRVAVWFAFANLVFGTISL